LYIDPARERLVLVPSWCCVLPCPTAIFGEGGVLQRVNKKSRLWGLSKPRRSCPCGRALVRNETNQRSTRFIIQRAQKCVSFAENARTSLPSLLASSISEIASIGKINTQGWYGRHTLQKMAERSRQKNGGPSSASSSASASSPSSAAASLPLAVAVEDAQSSRRTCLAIKDQGVRVELRPPPPARDSVPAVASSALEQPQHQLLVNESGTCGSLDNWV